MLGACINSRSRSKKGTVCWSRRGTPAVQKTKQQLMCSLCGEFPARPGHPFCSRTCALRAATTASTTATATQSVHPQALLHNNNNGYVNANGARAGAFDYHSCPTSNGQQPPAMLRRSASCVRHDPWAKSNKTAADPTNQRNFGSVGAQMAPVPSPTTRTQHVASMAANSAANQFGNSNVMSRPSCARTSRGSSSSGKGMSSLCSRCGRKEANPGHKWCESCYQASM